MSVPAAIVPRRRQSDAQVSGRIRRMLFMDPGPVLLCFSAWSLLSAVSLLCPGDIFDAVVVYQALRRLPVPEEGWGAAMMVDAVLLVWAAFHPFPPVRGLITILSAGLWMLFGSLVFIGGLENGVFSVIGTWEVAMSFALVAATMQSVRCYG